MVEAEKETLQGEEYVNESDPSVLRFLLASREEVVITALIWFYAEENRSTGLKSSKSI